jgi:hypothetical protein
MQNFDRFIYDSWSFNDRKGELSLKYSLDERIFFKETITFPVEKINTKIIKSESFKSAVDGLWIMSGISYFKAALPNQITFKDYDLHLDQKKFFEKIFLHGLGEFFYVNDIDPKGKINFQLSLTLSREELPKAERTETKTNSIARSLRLSKGLIAENFALASSASAVAINQIKIPFTQKHLPKNAKTLLPIGGGKDSLVSAILLNQANINYTPWMVGETKIQHDCCTKLEKNPLVVQRKICPNLIKINKAGALNGHVPISAIWAFLSVVTALLTDHTHVALSNEASANTENLEFKGLKINHQYSKSLEFEQDFQNYVEKFINSKNQSETKPVHYFSLLRNLREIDIAKIFAEHCWADFKDIFASCNRNFTISKKNTNSVTTTKKWCNNCPKCAFVFLILAPFVERETLIQTFGQNLFINPELTETFDELLGLSGHKPLECVGEIEECREALLGAKKNWPELKTWITALTKDK